MNIQQAIQHILDGKDLEPGQMQQLMHAIMSGACTPAQIAGFLIGLRMKGESVGEITAAAEVTRELSTKVNVGKEHLIDTCGTGGDGANTFNISTTSAFVAAAAGARVAKHGNRSVSSKSGSADVLEAAGVKLAEGLPALHGVTIRTSAGWGRVMRSFSLATRSTKPWLDHALCSSCN